MVTPSISRRRALIVSSHAATMRVGNQVLAALGWHARVVTGLALIPPCQRGEFEIALLDLDLDPAAPVEAMVTELVRRCPGTVVVAVAGHEARKRLLRAIGEGGVDHVLPKLRRSTTGDVTFDGPSERDLFSAALQLATPRPTDGRGHGVQPYLIGLTPVSETTIGSWRDRSDAIARVVGLGERLQLQGEKLRRIEVLAEELTLNALYDAPVDVASEDGGPDRSTPIKLDANEKLRLQFGCDGCNFAIAVSNGFGMLRKSVVAGHLTKLLEPRQLRPLADGGMGLSLSMAFNSANQLAFTLVPHALTEVVGLVDVAATNRASQLRGAAVHFFGADPA